MTETSRAGRFFYFLFATLTAAAFIIFGCMSWGDDDVYNFYFQKGGAPNSVTQTGRGQTSGTEAATTVPLAPTPLANPVVASPVVANPPAIPTTPGPAATASVAENQVSAVVPHPPEHEFKHFEVLAGYGQISDSVGAAGAYSLGVQYNFNRYIGVRAAGQFTAAETERPLHVLADSNQAANRYGGYADMVVTPIHIDMFGHPFLEISGHAGLLSVREFAGAAEPYNVNSAVRGFLGASAAFNLNDNLAIELFASLADGGKVERVLASADFRF